MAPPGYGSRRAVQREYDGDRHELEPPDDDVVWRAVRADDETYVFLHNFDRSLRANGKHRIWHTGVTVASNDASCTPMMHWTVEVVQPLPPAPSSSSPEENKTGFAYLPASKDMAAIKTQWSLIEKDCLSSPTKFSEKGCNVGCDDSVLVGSDVGSHACLSCSKLFRNCLCHKCTRRIKMALRKARGTSLGTDGFSFCLKCTVLVRGEHGHNRYRIPLDIFHGSQVAWVSKKEGWSAIFEGVQSDRHWDKNLGRPFLLHQPQGSRCEVCSDHISQDKLYGILIQFCSIQCWAHKAEEAGEFSWLGALIQADFDRPGEHYYFCSVCRCVFNSCEDDAEHLHDQHDNAEHVHDREVQALRVITEFVGGTAAIKIEVPAGHFMATHWKCIKDLCGGETLSSPNHLFRLRDEGEQRCKGCKLRLEDGGGQACSLECRLRERDPMMVPRQVKNQFKDLSELPGDQHPDI